MTILNATRIALHALGRNKLRATLTALGIIIGVGSLIALLSIGNGARAEVEEQVASLGQNVIQVSSGSITKTSVRQGLGSSTGLTLEDADAIKDEVSDVIAVSPEVKLKTQIVTGNRNWRTEVYGNSTEYFTIRTWALADGEYYTEQDVRGGSKVAVIGSIAAEELFAGEDPIGQTIRIRNVPFTIVGTLVAKGASASGSDQDDAILIPITTAVRYLVRKEDGVRRIYVKAASLEALPRVQQQISDLLLQRHHVELDAYDDAEARDFFKVKSQLEIAESATETSRAMTLLLGLIASVSLLVGGIGIMNIMLVSVTERTREIGIRMALGAHRRDIMRQFLIEAFVLSVLGGVIGILVGAGSAVLLAELAKWSTHISADAIVTASLFSAMVGIFFGYYPAQKASQLDPIEALHYE